MRNIIKKYLREAAGVPSGIYESSSDLYQMILNSINGLDDDFMEDLEDNKKEFNFSYDTDFHISDLHIQKINLSLTLVETDQVNRITLAGMTFKSTSRTEGAKIIPITEDNTISLDITYGIPPDTKVDKLKDIFKSEKTEIITSLSHELKHAYDNFKSPTQSLYGLSKYIGLKSVNIDIPPMRRFLFLLYYSHFIENLVRPSELYANMRENNISEVDFYNFITSTTIWDRLTELSNWNYDSFRDDLKNYQDKINEFVKQVSDEKQIKDDDLLIDEFLRLIYVNLVNRQLESAHQMLVKSFSEMIMGLSGDKEKLFDNIIRTASRFEKNPINFYKFEEDSFHKNSYILKKKIGKLYSLINKQ